ncbi:integrase core domain-containing protein [Paenarthrobacter sp. AT5]|uniref:integrase core domain-containing protein n=1 Tax=Paenarthrobacter TaxID=1742992 RepID=UPI001A98EFC3|nr:MULTISPECIES: integrase core domain-containing protein [Paenarthrobacter]QSZ53889.1 integrase [Paenarthrobacter ureafaciens]WOC62669.1 integrase core domain-containing protein [Paenarthrobacter sp. AT5]
MQDPLGQSERAYESRIGTADRDRIAEYILEGWAEQVSVDHSYAAAWDKGVMLASRRTWWRVAAQIEDQMLRPAIPTRSGNKRPPREKPVIRDTGPGQVWSGDITDLHSPLRGKSFKANSVLDFYSRHMVARRVEEREADHLAVEMFETAIADRPYVSNDNPFSESGFRTMKYRPGYPRVFKELETARAYLAHYVPWYNTQHKHSGIALFSPSQVHDGSWKELWKTRDQALQRYYDKNPERFHRRPSTPTPDRL